MYLCVQELLLVVKFMRHITVDVHSVYSVSVSEIFHFLVTLKCSGANLWESYDLIKFRFLGV